MKKRNELDELHALGDSKFGRPRSFRAAGAAGDGGSAVSALMASAGPSGAGRGGPSYSHAAASHHVNDAYVEDLAVAYGATRAEGRALARGSSSGSISSGGAAPLPSFRAAAARRPTAAASGPANWKKGPVDASGALLELSERPNLCMAVNPLQPHEVCIGSSDHALYVVDVRGNPPKKLRTLYGKKAGHTEWVTGVTYLGDGSGRIASCGMDGKIIVWANTGGASISSSSRADPSCSELLGHFGSVSCVDAVPGAGPLLLSSGYDKTVRLWDASSASCLREMRGHGAPVLLQALAMPADASPSSSAPPLVATGDRDGIVRLWDLEKGACSATLAGHKGHITSLAWFGADNSGGGCSGGSLQGANPIPPTYFSSLPRASAGAVGGHSIPTHSDVLFSGAQDGHFRAWDVRTKGPLANIELHSSEAGSGALGNIATAVMSNGEVFVVTAGADKCLCVLDPRMGFTPRHRLTTHTDFIYSLAVYEGIAFSGSGDGMLLAHDIAAGKPLWGLGANQAAVRCIGINPANNQLVATGDDGGVMAYDFPSLGR